MTNPINIPPVRLPDEPYTAAQLECYANRASDYLDAVQVCIKEGGDVQACIITAHNNYEAGLGICDTL